MERKQPAVGIRIVVMGEPMVEFSSIGKEKYGMSYSGDSVNVAVSAGRLGIAASVISAVGDDYFGRAMIRHLGEEGVGTDGLRIEKGGYTGAYFITLLGQGNHEFTYFRNHSSASRFTIREKELRLLEKGSVFHVSGIAQAIGANARRSVLLAARRAHSSGVKVSYDVNFRPRLWSRRNALKGMEELARYVDVLFISTEDWSLLKGSVLPAERIAHELKSEGYENIIVKAGPEGSYGLDGNRTFRQRSFPVKAVDATGAGDAYDAGFLCATLIGKDFATAMMYGSMNAGLKCRRKGGIRGLPTMRQLETALSTHR